MKEIFIKSKNFSSLEPENSVSFSKQAINNSQKQPKSRILSNQSKNMNFSSKPANNKSQKQPKCRILSIQYKNLNFSSKQTENAVSSSKHATNYSQKLWFSQFNIKIWISPIIPKSLKSIKKYKFLLKATWQFSFLLKAS